MEEKKNVVELDSRDYANEEARTVTITLIEYRELIEIKMTHYHCWHEAYEKDHKILKLEEQNQKLENDLKKLREKISNFVEGAE